MLFARVCVCVYVMCYNVFFNLILKCAVLHIKKTLLNYWYYCIVNIQYGNGIISINIRTKWLTR